MPDKKPISLHRIIDGLRRGDLHEVTDTLKGTAIDPEKIADALEDSRQYVKTMARAYVPLLMDHEKLTNLERIPRFLRSGVDMSKVSQGTGFSIEKFPVNAYVGNWNPHRIAVVDREGYTNHTRNHEMTHVYQMTRSRPVSRVGVPADYAPLEKRGAVARDEVYGYGGLEGLKKALKQGKKVTDFNDEQQADIVADYQSELNGFYEHFKQGDFDPDLLREYADYKRTYHPFIEQLSAMAGETGGGPSILAKPAAPSLPPDDTPGLGVAATDPLMAGYSFQIPAATKGKTGRKPMPNISIHRALAGVQNGDLHRATGTPEGKDIPHEKVEAAKLDPNPHTAAMAHLYGPSKIAIDNKPRGDNSYKAKAKPVKLGGADLNKVEVAGADDISPKDSGYHPYAGN